VTVAARFKQVDVTRALKGAQAAGFSVGRIEIDRHGNIVILSERSAPPPVGANEWDEVLK
jgi:hypothetical protein